MRYWAIAITGLVVCGLSVVAIDWGMWHLMLTGTCASGGPYVSARPCPAGTGWQIMAVVFGIFGGLIGVGIWTARGRSGERIESRFPLPLAMWSLLFCTLALSGLYAVLGPAAGPDAPKGTAIFLAVLFIPMGLAPALFALRGGTTTSATASINAASTHVATAHPRSASATESVVGDPSKDSLAKIEKLGDLRDKGLITEAEFEVQKQRLLREV